VFQVVESNNTIAPQTTSGRLLTRWSYLWR
jgi:hypothetical protein